LLQWSGGGYPGYGYAGDNYSWVATASKQGYPTFAFDRLGNGNSTLANGITEVQCPAQAATVHEMVAIIRSGPTGGSPLPRAFDKIILVGSSLGSIVANSTFYPMPSSKLQVRRPITRESPEQSRVSANIAQS
jgi:pimeloyl-ACP methyl ester carboxylesterase